MEISEAIYQNDPVLIPFLNSVEEKTVATALAELLERYIQPVIERSLRAKMRVSLKSNDFSQSNQEALEIAGEAKLLLIAELGKLKSNIHGKFIQNLPSYVVSVTINAYRENLRKKYPLRQQLKNKLRYLLTHHPELELEESESGLICGFKKKGRRAAPAASEHIKTEAAARLEKTNLIRPEQTIELVKNIFSIAEAPILFNDLLSIVSEIQGVKDKPVVSEAEVLPSQHKSITVENKTLFEIEKQQILKRIWLEILELPLRHRIALLLNLKDKSGDCVIRLFPILRVASIRKIAEALEFPPEEFASVWNELPWEDLRIAEYLGLTRQQVINLRQSARARLVRLTGG